MPRKNPYSGKQKKQQLKERKARKQDGPKYLSNLSDDEEDQEDDKGASGGMKGVPFQMEDAEVQKINAQPELKSKFSINSFRLHFLKEPDDVIKKKKKRARKPIKRLCESRLEYRVQDVYSEGVNLDFPKRPEWNYNLSKEKLEIQERHYFQEYLNDMVAQPQAEDLSYFELNLENWRQLWRVLEISDILLVIADIRYPVLHIPPSLIRYVQEILNRPVIIILNKIDFVAPMLAIAWKRYLQEEFPGISVVFFSSFLKKQNKAEYNSIPIDFNTSEAMYRKPEKGSVSSFGPAELYHAVSDIVKDKVDLSRWRQQLEEERLLTSSVSDSLSQAHLLQTEAGNTPAEVKEEKANDPHRNRDKEEDCESCESKKTLTKSFYKDGVVTLGCIGYPNVGKSSVLNALKGKKVVSVSQTPGHTKHLQTIFLTPTVKLCDCPGLVFPSIVPKALQVIAGIFPIAQVREPYSVVQYLGEHIPLPSLLRIRPPHLSSKDSGRSDNEYNWSAYDICEAWAIKCGFVTAKAARPDLYRAANNILRLAVGGQLRICFRPPHYSHTIDDLKSDSEALSLHNSLMTRARSSLESHEEAQKEEEEDSEEENDDWR